MVTGRWRWRWRDKNADSAVFKHCFYWFILIRSLCFNVTKFRRPTCINHQKVCARYVLWIECLLEIFTHQTLTVFNTIHAFHICIKYNKYIYIYIVFAFLKSFKSHKLDNTTNKNKTLYYSCFLFVFFGSKYKWINLRILFKKKEKRK